MIQTDTPINFGNSGGRCSTWLVYGIIQCGQPEDVAAALLYLVSPEARMVNGQTLPIDGGWTTVGHVP